MAVGHIGQITKGLHHFPLEYLKYYLQLHHHPTLGTIETSGFAHGTRPDKARHQNRTANVEKTEMNSNQACAHYDVIIIGAGISGLGAACHLQRECPDKRYVILYTYGYDFKPWYGKPIATADEILRYLHEVVEENQLTPHIRFGHHVASAAWSTAEAQWTVEVTTAQGVCQVTGNFLFMCQGYYNYQAGYRPQFPGEENFQGQIIHPQAWPEDLDYTGKHMVVIGSGATAATIVPAVADRVAHVTQLQRSPSYYLPVDNRGEDDDLIKQLRALDVPQTWIYEIKRRKSLKEGQLFTVRALNEPGVVREELLGMAATLLPADYDINTHFSPRYNPWKERLCLLPEGDFFQAIASGKASVVTDQIECFVADGILLQSGQKLLSDIIVTATGIELCGLGDIPFTVDGAPVRIPDLWTYKGIMFSDLPNLAWTFGYIRSSWTLRSDLIARYVCRLLQHMAASGARQCTPRLRPEDQHMSAKPFIDPADFAPGYMQRGGGRLPKQGGREPWTNCQDYYLEKDLLPTVSLADGVLQFTNAGG
jgi:cation diffusion facilitator CzcD-associated flavoprotein CzcO